MNARQFVMTCDGAFDIALALISRDNYRDYLHLISTSEGEEKEGWKKKANQATLKYIEHLKRLEGK